MQSRSTPNRHNPTAPSMNRKTLRRKRPIRAVASLLLLAALTTNAVAQDEPTFYPTYLYTYVSLWQLETFRLEGRSREDDVDRGTRGNLAI